MRPARRGLPCMAEHASVGQGIVSLIISISLELFRYLHSSHHCYPPVRLRQIRGRVYTLVLIRRTVLQVTVDRASISLDVESLSAVTTSHGTFPPLLVVRQP